MNNKKLYLIGSIIITLSFFVIFFQHRNNVTSRELEEMSNKFLKEILDEKIYLFDYGDECPEFSITSLNGKIFAVKNGEKGVLLIRFFFPDTSRNNLKYFSFIEELCNRYNINKNSILNISLGNLVKTQQLINSFKIPFPFEIINDDDFILQRIFRLEASPGLFIVRNGKIVFNFKGSVSPLLMKQLLIKYF